MIQYETKSLSRFHFLGLHELTELAKLSRQASVPDCCCVVTTTFQGSLLFFNTSFSSLSRAHYADRTRKMYIDLNPIRASIASTPEESEFTGVFERINDLRMFFVESNGEVELRLGHSSPEVHQWERLGEGSSAWLSPVEIDERLDPVGPDVEPSGRRVSRKGVLPMPLLKYLDLLDFTGRQIRSDKRGSIPRRLSPILTRIGVAFESLVNAIEELALRHQPYFHSTERNGRPDRQRTELELSPS